MRLEPKGAVESSAADVPVSADPPSALTRYRNALRSLRDARNRVHAREHVIIESAGYPNINGFWADFLSQLMPASDFIALLADPSWRRNSGPELDSSSCREHLCARIDDAIRSRKPWITRDAALARSYLSIRSGKIRWAPMPQHGEVLEVWLLEARSAAIWVNSSPLYRGVLPDSLRNYLEPATKSGPNPTKRDAVVSAMRRYRDTGGCLEGMKQVAMEAEFRASRGTCVSARKIVVSEFNSGKL